MKRSAAEAALPARAQSRRLFDQAAQRFDTASVVHDLTRQRLLERLPLIRLEPGTLLDLGCGTGRGLEALAACYPGARLLAVDSSAAMLAAAMRRGSEHMLGLVGDAEQLPLRARSIDLLLVNLVLPWTRPDAAFREAARVLTADGLLLFATLGPDSLQEVRHAWRAVDDQIHVHSSYDMHDLGDMAAACGLREPVLDVDRVTLSYADVRSLVADLRACGASNIAAGRRRGLTSRQRWVSFEQGLLETAQAGRFQVTLELIFGQAWGPPAGAQAQTQAGPTEVAVPLGRIARRRRSR